jgi:hypothetical protein
MTSEASSLAASSMNCASMPISACGGSPGVVPFISVTLIGQSRSTLTTDRARKMALTVERTSSHGAVNAVSSEWAMTSRALRWFG